MTIPKKTLLAVASGLAVILAGTGKAAIAAENVVLTYGFFSTTIPIEDLETLADTGEASNELGQLLDIANQEPAELQTALNQPIELRTTVLDLALNSPPGEWMLDRVSETIQPASGEGGPLALRAAIIGASADDNQITLLELMQVYPSPEIVVQGDRVLEAYNYVSDVIEPFQDLAEVLDSVPW
ncbi:MAG: alpha/beta hydrolase [Cyanobacteria bacterium P01_F01_bin.86]